jgi:hypothetical protein
MMTMTPSTMPTDALETLRQVNRNLRSALARLRPEQRHCSAITPQDFSDILDAILQARECLRRQLPTSEAAVALKQESLAYLSNLEELKQFLPELHANLLAEKSRLETVQTHVAATAAWAQASEKNF